MKASGSAELLADFRQADDFGPLLLHGHQDLRRRPGPRVLLAARVSLRGLHRLHARRFGSRAPTDPPAPPSGPAGRQDAPARTRLSSKRTPVFLLICDGWGHAPPSQGNAIALARTPIYDRWIAEHPWTLLDASGEAVGLPAGVMGNSEVGHLTLGAGRMVPQDLLRIDLALRDGSFFENPPARSLRGGPPQRGATLHVMGLLSDGGRALAPAASRRAPRARRPRARAARAHPRLHRRTGHAAALGARATSPRSRPGSIRPRPGSPPSRAATTPWTGTSGGTASRAPTRRSSSRRACRRRARGTRSSRRTPGTNRTSSSSRR